MADPGLLLRFYEIFEVGELVRKRSLMGIYAGQGWKHSDVGDL